MIGWKLNNVIDETVAYPYNNAIISDGLSMKEEQILESRLAELVRHMERRDREFAAFKAEVTEAIRETREMAQLAFDATHCAEYPQRMTILDEQQSNRINALWQELEKLRKVVDESAQFMHDNADTREIAQHLYTVFYPGKKPHDQQPLGQTDELAMLKHQQLAEKVALDARDLCEHYMAIGDHDAAASCRNDYNQAFDTAWCLYNQRTGQTYDATYDRDKGLLALPTFYNAIKNKNHLKLVEVPEV